MEKEKQSGKQQARTRKSAPEVDIVHTWTVLKKEEEKCHSAKETNRRIITKWKKWLINSEVKLKLTKRWPKLSSYTCIYPSGVRRCANNP